MFHTKLSEETKKAHCVSAWHCSAVAEVAVANVVLIINKQNF